MNRTKALEIVGYAGFFVVCFGLFAYWTFPYDRLGSFIENKVAESGSGYTIRIGEISPYWGTGLELTRVTLRKQNADEVAQVDANSEAKKEDDAFRIREARVRLGILAALIGNRKVSFDAELEQGEIEGTFTDSGDQKHLDATLTSVDVGKLGLLDSVISLPVKGTAEGDFDLTLGKEPTKSNGTAKLRIRNLTLGDGVAKLKVGAMGGLTIEPVEAGTVNIELDVKDGVGTVKKLTNDGKDIELEGSGEVRLTEPLSRSRFDVLLRLKIKDAYREKSERTKTLMSLLDGMSVPQVRSAKTPDGSFQYRLAGTAAGLRAIPAGRARVGGSAAGASQPARGSTVESVPAEDDDE